MAIDPSSSSSEDLEESSLINDLTANGAVHTRVKVFTDPDLIADSDFWITLARNLRQDIFSEFSSSASGKEVQSQIEAFLNKSRNKRILTPPFKVITFGLNRNRSCISNRGTAVGSENPQQEYFPPVEIHENPAERLRFFGADYLRSSELLSLLLQPDGVHLNNENPESIAAKILSEYGTRALTAERNPGRMAELLGVTIDVASRVVAILELGRRFFEETTTKTPFIRSPEDAYKYLKDMALLKKEHLR